MTQSNPPSHSLHHRRTPSSSNASKVRTSRPALHRKGTSFVNHSISKLGSGNARPSIDKEDDRQFEMAASFLNFCAMCERQITVPNNSLLYCSEICRRKDSCKPLSASTPANNSMSHSTTPPTSPPMSPRTIVPPMIPTKDPMAIPSLRIHNDAPEAGSDIDPTEWKPVIDAGSGSSTPLASSEAWNYLAQFHGNGVMVPTRRPGAGHRSSASLSTLMSANAPLPSLSHTPSTVASSVSSSASDYMSYMHEPAHRPLPPRHNPYFPSCSSSKGVELVMPHVETPAEDTTVDMSDSGSIFPASSAIWRDSSNEKTPTPTVAAIPVSKAL
ncbi:hypothetical protein ASPWEDRAFT_120551 [Aspergillus wentii DTO 134E9]|uniref:Life-span regulatory factor domain-containing protein n=1 Tax=Aspergillus wentii DTO 134E9 TaxID=1073089 RepID=A0A1L9R6W7_ASPWE|nr:uncharacterized protein ASPWEDRAFT_120551 [Aspergillus wentii DTO 134E9]OJJ30661.1 hypothetical protein ASPWEDRAFT_120551 [Aspergillus wentii DTO 134E9]